MSFLRLCRIASVVFLSLAIPVSMLAADAPILATPDSASVTRADFLRASVQTLHITLRNNVTLQYRRPVPVSLQPYVKTALYYKALPFGNSLNLAQSITRGEAIQILAGLSQLSPAQTYSASYTDVGSDSALQRAVALALEHQWLTPDSSKTFGVGRALKGSEARALLQAAALTALPQGTSGQSSSSSVPTISISLKGKPAQTKTLSLPNQEMLQAVWQLLNNQYLYQENIDPQEAAYKAAEAIVETLKDPYTMFLRPLPAKEFSDQIGGQITGIGAQVEYKDNILTVVAPIAGSPSEKAGLKSGDQLLAADGVNITNIGFLEAVNKIRGPKGTSVKIHVNRGGMEFDVIVVRDTITLPEIDVSYQGTIAVVRLAQFGETTDSKLRGILKDVNARKPSGIILDLRNNPGGLLHAADTVLSNFLPNGSTVAHIVSTVDDSLEKTSEEPTIDATIPLVVLVNKGSASAAEITAGALQDYKRGTIVGEQSFGKGTVQQILQFRDGSELKMTIAEWLTPLKRKINHTGVVPDVIVPSEDGRDEQMLKALDILRR